MDTIRPILKEDSEDSEFDPRIPVELEALNTATNEINKLEILLEEANTTFRILLNESMRRLKALHHKLGGCIDRARPYFEAMEIAKKAQSDCQKAALNFQRANEIHQAAKETVALAEARYLSKQHEWTFDSAWQEMLNHAIMKVTEAEQQKAESGREHQKRAMLFNAAEQRALILEEKLKRSILKSRPYFDVKALCQDQLDAQKKRVEELQRAVSRAKQDYACSLRRLEDISEEIHRKRTKSGSSSPLPQGPREPGVGAELNSTPPTEFYHPPKSCAGRSEDGQGDGAAWYGELEYDLNQCDALSLGSVSLPTSSAVSETEETPDPSLFDELRLSLSDHLPRPTNQAPGTPMRTESLLKISLEDVDELRQKVKELSVVEDRGEEWAKELSETISRLDNAMLQKECKEELDSLFKSKEKPTTSGD